MAYCRKLRNTNKYYPTRSFCICNQSYTPADNKKQVVAVIIWLMTEVKSFVYTLACSEGTRLSRLISLTLINLNNHLNNCFNQSDLLILTAHGATLIDVCQTSSGSFYPVESMQGTWHPLTSVLQSDRIKCCAAKELSRTVSSRHGLVVVKMDALWAGDLHDCSMQTGVLDQPHHPLCYQRWPGCRHRGGKRIRWATESQKQKQRDSSAPPAFKFIKARYKEI